MLLYLSMLIVPYKDNNDNFVMHPKSDNKEIMAGKAKNEIINEFVYWKKLCLLIGT